eukprot:CAMPEP_0204368768 /NCGR_PEP_ID=MMETSP0469-20131031/44446_1 /ASSEMBLY_ACC=CAM_ASM_000384 /TAXON_ID=2969 /ORGANISM="Oxyrrhis marina" /LENGTH=34 /DNA_ID= /DNA_START= /DNA_END= /DNA_ORIENTATION=
MNHARLPHDTTAMATSSTTQRPWFSHFGDDGSPW